MIKTLINHINKDARNFQIIALGSLLSLLTIWSAFPPRPEVIALTFLSTIGTQFFFYKILKIQSHDFRSPFITALSLCLLFKSNILWLFPLAGAVAMASKFLIRYNGKHIFNPANMAIVSGLLLFPQQVWVSPGQWGNAIWLGFALICLAYLVLNKAGRADMALFFLISWGLLLLGRANFLGDPLDIPAHNLQSGAILIFSFFMISDPMTTPNHRTGRLLFAAATAIIAYVLAYKFQIREAIFYALFVVSMSTPFIDMILKYKPYRWSQT